MAEIIDAAIITSVRNLLGVTAAQLPDATITDPVIGGRAETEIMDELGPPDYLDRPLEEQERIRTAVTYLTAAYCVTTLRAFFSTTSERFSDQYQVSRNPGVLDLDAWATWLTNRAWEHLEPLKPSIGAGVTHFRLAHGRRGG